MHFFIAVLSPNATLFTMGGYIQPDKLEYHYSQFYKTVDVYNISGHKVIWSHRAKDLPFEWHGGGVTSYGTDLFIAGGQRIWPGSHYAATDRVFKYDCRSDQYMELPELKINYRYER